MSIRYSEANNVTISGNSKVVLKDFIVLRRGNERHTLDASVDLGSLHPSLHNVAVRLLESRRVTVEMLTDEQLIEMDQNDRKWREQKAEFERRKAAYRALPWYRRIFRWCPRLDPGVLV